MAGYALIDVEITDHAVFAEFRERAPAVVEAHGGRFLVRGGRRGQIQTLVASPPPSLAN